MKPDSYKPPSSWSF